MNVVSETVGWLADPANWSGPNGIPTRLEEHVGICVAAMLIALAISLPAGLYAGHTRRWSGLAASLAIVGRALPSLALIGLV
ncbi:MAG TPA: hypothetical protein VIH37_00240, partial [Candidatus Limnocylindrales bacterium]